MEKNLSEGSILKNIIVFSLPFLLSYFLQTLYGMADLFISGQFYGADIITAVSVGSQIMHMLTVIIVGLSMGGSVMIGQAIGAKDKEKTSKSIANTVIVFIVFSAVVTVLLLSLTRAIVNLVSVPEESVEQTIVYLRICFAGIPFIVAYNVIASIYRGMGDSKSPMIFVAVACVLNIVLDFVFMGVLDMKAGGAALGTVISQTVSVIVSLFAILKSNSGIKIKKSDFKIDKSVLGGILKIGFPIACQDGFIQVSFVLITIIANKRGVEIAAAVGIVEKIIGFLFLVPSSMLSTVSAISAQCFGAGKPERAEKTLWIGVGIAAAFGIVVAAVCQFVSVPFIRLFTRDSVVVDFGSQYLKSYVLDCIFAAVHFSCSGFFTAMGKSIVSFIHNICSIVLVRVPVAFFASKLFPETLYPMGLAAPLGSLLSAVICVAFYFSLKNRIKEKKK